MTNTRLFTVALGALAGYFVAGVAITLQSPRPWDVAFLLWVQQVEHPVWDVAFAAVAIAGSTEVTSAAVILAAGWLWRTGRRSLACVLLAFFVMYPFELIGKAFLPQDPPGLELIRDVYRYPLNRLDLGHSFPSGHAGRFVFFSTLAWLWVGAHSGVRGWGLGVRGRHAWTLDFGPRNLDFGLLPALARGTIVLVALPVLVSRIYIGAHWPSDVLGGALLGTAIATAALGWYATPELQPEFVREESAEPRD